MVLVLVLVAPADLTASHPSAFAPASGPQRVGPGTIGCRTTSNETCYAVAVTISLGSVHVSDFFFAVEHSSRYSYPERSNVPLGTGATVTLVSPGTDGASWNWTQGAWTQGGSASPPDPHEVSFVLDTGLTSNATLAGAWFWVELGSPYDGSVGFALDGA